jgi:hypothetical protein
MVREDLLEGYISPRQAEAYYGCRLKEQGRNSLLPSPLALVRSWAGSQTLVTL